MTTHSRRGRAGRPFMLAFCVLVMGLGLLAACKEATTAAPRESLLDRVLRSREIRASYANYPPYCIKDPNTGKLSGVFVDVLEEAGRRLELKVNWVEEVGWGSIFEGLNSNRHDVFGAGIWRNSSRAKVGDFSRPLFYNVILAYGRANETRFTDSLEGADDPSVRITTMDGAIDDLIRKADYPHSSPVSVPQLNPVTDMLLNITSNKADLTFAEPSFINLYQEKNPGTLKALHGGKPVRVFANTIAFRTGEPEFKAMLDAVLDEMLNDGTVDRILSKYEKHPGEFWRIAPAYAIPAER